MQLFVYKYFYGSSIVVEIILYICVYLRVSSHAERRVTSTIEIRKNENRINNTF